MDPEEAVPACRCRRVSARLRTSTDVALTSRWCVTGLSWAMIEVEIGTNPGQAERRTHD